MDFPGHPYSDPLELALRRELQPGERVMWQARPQARIRWGAFALYVFAIPWTAFSIFWTVMAFAGVTSMDPGGAGFLAYAFPLFGVPFVLIGLAMLAPPFMPLLNASKRLFAVTDRRVIEMHLGRKQLVTKSIEAQRLGPIERSESPDGSGWLKIAVGSHHDSDGDLVVDHLEIGRVTQVMQAEETIRAMLARLRREAGGEPALSS